MRITKIRLHQIIKEEIGRLYEGPEDDMTDTPAGMDDDKESDMLGPNDPLARFLEPYLYYSMQTDGGEGAISVSDVASFHGISEEEAIEIAEKINGCKIIISYDAGSGDIRFDVKKTQTGMMESRRSIRRR